jgi:hypothetical protein
MEFKGNFYIVDNAHKLIFNRAFSSIGNAYVHISDEFPVRKNSLDYKGGNEVKKLLEEGYEVKESLADIVEQ